MIDPAVDGGFDFVEVGAPGNPYYDGPTFNSFPRPGTGRVNHRYRIMRVEISAEQWLEFANAFGPLGDPFLLGRQARELDTVIGIPAPQFAFTYRPGEDPGSRPVSGISWRNAARYCNWLHNGKEVSLEALADGAYDTSTWGEGDCDFLCLTDAPFHELDARYWLPTLDEWMKAVHYDASAGWQIYPNGSNNELISGVPGDPGAETNTGGACADEDLCNRIGRYPNVQSPWGLLDASGGVSEWTGTWVPGLAIARRYVAGSHFDQSAGLILDRSDRVSSSRPDGLPAPGTGIRLASISLYFGDPDVNKDGRVDFQDLNVILVHWGATSGPGDANADGVVDFDDVALILAGWGCGSE